MGKMEIITGPERRRRWSDEEKRRILEEAAQPGVSAAAVARGYDLMPQQLYGWRCEAKKRSAAELKSTSFLPVEVIGTVPGDEETTTTPARRGNRTRNAAGKRIEIVCRNDRILKCEAGIDAERLQALIRAVEAA